MIFSRNPGARASLSMMGDHAAATATIQQPTDAPLRRLLIFGGIALIVIASVASTSGLSSWEGRTQLFFALPFALAIATVVSDAEGQSAPSLVHRVRKSVVVASVSFLRLRHHKCPWRRLPRMGAVVATALITALVAVVTARDGRLVDSRSLRITSIGVAIAGLANPPLRCLGFSHGSPLAARFRSPIIL